jgi:Rrf2 family protein
MKLSTKGRYSTRLMIDLAIYGPKRAVLLKDIARRQEISEKYLGHLVPLLKNAGLIHTARGAKGGFSLARPVKDITLKDIISAVEGPICLVECVNDPTVCKRMNQCAARDFWGTASNAIQKVLEGFTLESMAQEQKKNTETHSYAI